MSPRHLTRLADLDDATLEAVLELSSRLRRGEEPGSLAGRTLGMLFFRGSLRTRASFEAAAHRLGGEVVNLTAMSDFWELEDREGAVMDGRAPEHVKDAAAVLSRYFHALAIRPDLGGRSWDVDRQDAGISTWSRHATVPVINMESALWHPLQALADLVTLREELGELRGRDLAITWVHSPAAASASVVHSLLHAALRKGMNVRVARRVGHELDGRVLDEARTVAEERGGQLSTNVAMGEAVKGAAVVYARSWQSLETYGNPTLAASRRSSLRDWRIDAKLLAETDGAKLMHAMPVRRNVEVTDEVLDGPASLLYEQAANRLWSQMALLRQLVGG